MLTANDREGRGAPRCTDGKFLRVDGHRFLVKGVTYGTFAPDAQGVQYPPLARASDDFAAMARAGINTVRLYTVPPRALLDRVADAGLKAMVGIPWAQHVAFLDAPHLATTIRRDVTRAVGELGDHPAALLFALGNEIPPGVVRWHGAKRIDRFLGDLLDAARQAAPEALFTYVNYPPTEFLDLEAFDVCAFNIYLHREHDLRAYLARLHHIAGPRPLLLAEAGADSCRETEEGQARLTAMHLRAAFEEGAAGAIAFAWTDEWWRGGGSVDDWRFGLVDAARRPKRALAAVQSVFETAPFPDTVRSTWPKVSVVVCAYNAAGTITECLDSLENLSYPDFEVIVVNDGSTDRTGELARQHPRVSVIDVPNGGLSAARNIGAREATGAIVAYTDADVRVDRDWLTYLVQPFLTSDVMAAGGPNVAPVDDPWVAQCVARGPGAPTHVMLDDRIAEHVPGCNMAFRRDALLAVGGFNPTYVKAGDDVDVCWRIQARGWKIGFAPAALVWHRHRASVRAYWRQQVGYGEGEAWLQRDHPDKFAGRQMLWQGRIYSGLPLVRAMTRRLVNTGRWGLSPFPSVYHTAVDPLGHLPHSAGWQIGGALLAALGALIACSATWETFGLALLLLGVTALTLTALRVLHHAWSTPLSRASEGRSPSRLRVRTTIAWLHLVQPWARLNGRVQGALRPPVQELSTASPARRPGAHGRDYVHALELIGGAALEWRFWNERWHHVGDLLQQLTNGIRSARLARYLELDDGWRQDHDVAVPVGDWIRLELGALVEEHERGRVLVRLRLRLRLAWTAVIAIMGAWIVTIASLNAAAADRWPGAAVSLVGLMTLAFGVLTWRIAHVLAAIRGSAAKAAGALGGVPLDRGKPALHRLPDVSTPAFATRGLLVLLLIAGPLFGAAALVTERGTRGLMSTTQAGVTLPLASATGESLPIWRQLKLGLAVGPNGDIYFADTSADGIRRVTGSGDTSVVEAAFPSRHISMAGVAPTTATVAPRHFSTPGGVAVARSGDVFVADTRGHRVYRVDRVTGATTTVAGTGEPGWSGDGGPAVAARLNTPTAVALDRQGNLLIVDSGNDRIRRVSYKGGRIETIAGNSSRSPVDDVGDGGRALDARLAWPSDLVVAPNGDLYVADTEHHRVRRIDARTGIITTVAGSGRDGATGDGGPATKARLGAPTGLALVVRGRQRTLFVADASNGRVRVVAPDGLISSLPVPAGITLRQPARLAYHPGGWLYVADSTADRLTALEVHGTRYTAVPLNASRARATRPM